MIRKNMKGVCEISLIDADGNVVKKTRDENMLTNAIPNLFKFSTSEAGCGSSISTFATTIYANLKNYFGGVMLFNDTIEENPDCVYPPSNVINIGHAGSAYSGGNTNRGTLNSVESCNLSNGYKFVWDFGTSVANGTIKSVCLTSTVGGDLGYDNSMVDTESRDYIGLTMECGKGNLAPTLGSNYRFICKETAKDYIFITANSSLGNTINFYRVSLFNRPRLLSNTFTKTELIKTSTSAKTICDYVKMFNDGTNIYSVIQTSYTNINFVKYDMVGNIIEDKSITLSPASTFYLNIFGILGNYIIGATNNCSKVLKINMLTGQTEELINPISTSILGNYYKASVNVNGRLFFMSGFQDSNTGGISFDLKNGFHLHRCWYDYRNYYNYQLHPIIDKSTPIVTFTDSSYNQGKMFPFYMATIDNLSTPVTKTSSLSMKVTYTITEVEEETV